MRCSGGILAFLCSQTTKNKLSSASSISSGDSISSSTTILSSTSIVDLDRAGWLFPNRTSSLLWLAALKMFCGLWGGTERRKSSWSNISSILTDGDWIHEGPVVGLFTGTDFIDIFSGDHANFSVVDFCYGLSPVLRFFFLSYMITHLFHCFTLIISHWLMLRLDGCAHQPIA